MPEGTLSILGRSRPLFERDLERSASELAARVRESAFLVLGGAGSIGREVVRAVFRRGPRRLDVVDVSENSLVELVRDLRSSVGYIDGEFRTLALDCGDLEFAAFVRDNEPYDYVLNLAALKHVRSEKDPFTLMRMVRANVLNTEETLRLAIESGSRRYFAVSSDKAANPASAMGATKRAMELCLVRAAGEIEVSSARFANVAFSDGSLLDGFIRRLEKRQPLSAPEDVRRYFISGEEAATLCLMACLAGGTLEAFFPKPSTELEAVDFRTLAERLLAARGLEAHPCASEDEARGRVEELAARGRWPCYFFSSDTTGEKEIEEFFTAGEEVDLDRYREIGVLAWKRLESDAAVERFLAAIRALRAAGRWTREEILAELKALVPGFDHRETGKFLDSRM